MPQTSSAALAIVPGKTTGRPRLVAPKDLSKPERKVWSRVVDSLPPAFFVDVDRDALANYCRHQATVESLTTWLLENPAGTPEWRANAQLRLQESRQALALSRGLHLLKSARTDGRVAAGSAARSIQPPTLEELRARYSTEDDEVNR